MKTALQIDVAQLFGEPLGNENTALQPRIRMSNATCQQYSNPKGQACLQQFDGLLGFINIMDVHIPSDIVIPLRVRHSDIHIFYVITDDSAIQIKDIRQQPAILFLSIVAVIFTFPQVIINFRSPPAGIPSLTSISEAVFSGTVTSVLSSFYIH